MPGVARQSRIIMQRAFGCNVVGVDGRQHMDLTSGIGVLSTGHCHPHVSWRVRSQALAFVHAQQNCVESSVQHDAFLQAFEPHVPEAMSSVYFSNSGTDAIENSVKVARKCTRRPNIVSFIGGFHGRSIAGMALSTSKASCRYGVLMPGVVHAEFPHEERTLAQNVDSFLQTVRRSCSPDETAAVLMEPVQGEGGVRRMQPEFARFLREWCTQQDVLLISDEVQTGCGRTGKWWAYEHFGITPDMLVFAKGIASGYPLAGVVASGAHFANMHANGLGGTYNGNAVSLAAAVATMEVLRDVVPDVEAKGARLRAALAAHPAVTAVRQYGLMIAFDLDTTPDEFERKMDALRRHRLIVLRAGIGPTVRILPPLTITSQEVDDAISRLLAWLDDA